MNKCQSIITTLPKECQVHLWLLDLAKDLDQFAYCESILSAAEIARARSFWSKKLYQNYVFSKGKLKQVLGQYLQIDPKEVLFHYSNNGKPFLKSAIEFNISHSKDLVIFAITSGPVGVDVQYQSHLADLIALCSRFLSLQECAEILASPKAYQPQVFYDFWVKKEAYTKALGGRIFDVLAKFKAQNLHINHQTDLYLQRMDLRDDYACAIATTQKITSLRCKWLNA